MKYQEKTISKEISWPYIFCLSLSVFAEPEPVFQASLTSAQVLLPGSQASLSSLLFEGHSLLALASIMFAHGGIDKVQYASANQNVLPFLKAIT